MNKNSHICIGKNFGGINIQGDDIFIYSSFFPNISYRFNRTAKLIWDEIEKNNSINGIVDALNKKYPGIDDTKKRQDLFLILKKLWIKGFVDFSDYNPFLCEYSYIFENELQINKIIFANCDSYLKTNFDKSAILNAYIPLSKAVDPSIVNTELYHNITCIYTLNNASEILASICFSVDEPNGIVNINYISCNTTTNLMHNFIKKSIELELLSLNINSTLVSKFVTVFIISKNSDHIDQLNTFGFELDSELKKETRTGNALLFTLL